MDAGAASETTVPFQSPERYLADLDPETMAQVLASAADVALVLEDGVIRDVALGNAELMREGYDRAWLGKPWIDTVTTESRPKVEDLLHVPGPRVARWRQVNHPSAAGPDVPVKYIAQSTSDPRRVIALGRDLRSIAQLQQRLVEAHQSLERDYSRLRAAEARYRLLFRSISQPVLIVDPEGARIEEANPAAGTALGRSAESLAGTPLADLFTERSRRSLVQAVTEAMAVGQARVSNLELEGGGACDVTASASRQDEGTRLIVRLKQDVAESEGIGAASPRQVLMVFEELPDGLVVAGSDLRILAANRAFVELAHLMGGGQLVGLPLAEFLGRSATELNVLVSNLKNHGMVRNFTTVLRDRVGNEEEVEVSAVSAPLGDLPIYGFSVRSIARRLRSGPRMSEGLPSSVDQLTGLVGRVPLRQIVRESTDFIEKLCIEAALEITDDNRASAAEMLGLSRQGLYTKLKRFGFDES